MRTSAHFRVAPFSHRNPNEPAQKPETADTCGDLLSRVIDQKEYFRPTDRKIHSVRVIDQVVPLAAPAGCDRNFMEILNMRFARSARWGVFPVVVLALAVTASAQIYPYAGTGTAGSAGIGGDPLSLQLNTPMGIASISQSTAYIADLGNNRVVCVSGTANLYPGNGPASSPAHDC